MSLLRLIIAAILGGALIWPLPALAGKGTLRIATDPGDAQIFINGKRIGNSPVQTGQTLSIRLNGGEYSVEARVPSDGPEEKYGKKSVFVAEDSLRTLAIELKERASPNFRANLKAKYGGRAIEPLLVAIPAGSFRMGCVEGKDCGGDEQPVRDVNVPAFEMAKHEVSFDEWDACVADGGCNHWPDDEGWGRGTRPVINVSWDDAQAYIAWLNKKTGQQYRLPSEAEWEYAARAGSTTRFNTGDCITSDQANFNGSKPEDGCPMGEYRRQTLPVGSFAANAWGLYDMHGNVWEWVQDCWMDNYTGAPCDGSARADGDCSRRGARGGSWYIHGYWLRSADRSSSPHDARYYVTGFRLSKSR